MDKTDYDSQQLPVGGIMLSARDQFKGTVKSITRGSAEGMNLKVGDEVLAVVKATEVMVAKG